MRIGINVSWMSPGQAGGMEWYVRNLVAELERLDERHRYVLVASPANAHLFELRSRRWEKVIYAGPESAPDSFALLPPVVPEPGSWADRLRLRRWLESTPARRWLGSTPAPPWPGSLSALIRHERLDLWFCPLMYALPLDTDVPAVVTIPDLQHEHFREFFPQRELALRTLGLQYTCRQAAATIGISEFVRRDLIARYHLDPRRTIATPLALDPSFATAPELLPRLANEVRLKYGLAQDFIYYPANGWRHKNHEALVRALTIVRAKGRDLHLVLTGCEFDVGRRLEPLFGSRAEAEAVHHLGYVSREDTVGLYAAATLMVFPSLFEGFGFPLLEAMQVGTPVICLPVGSVPEVSGDAVVYADPPDDIGIADAIVRVLDDAVLRQRLVAAGRARVGRFSFTDTARRTLAVFEAVLDGSLAPGALPPFRPLTTHRWLRDGHSRWYFHCEDLRAVRVNLLQPTPLPELAEQRVRITLDERMVLESAVEPARVCALTITPSAEETTDFHRLDVSASRVTRVRGETLSVQVQGLTMVAGDGSELALLP